jgi:hypothetical protein
LDDAPSSGQVATTSPFARSTTATWRAAGTFAKRRVPSLSSWNDSAWPASLTSAARFQVATSKATSPSPPPTQAIAGRASGGDALTASPPASTLFDWVASRRRGDGASRRRRS